MAKDRGHFRVRVRVKVKVRLGKRGKPINHNVKQRHGVPQRITEQSFGEEGGFLGMIGNF